MTLARGLAFFLAMSIIAIVEAQETKIDNFRLSLAPIGFYGNREEWSRKIAKRLTTPDVSLLLKSYDSKESRLLKIMEDYQETRLKDSGIRLLANWGNALAHLYEVDSEVDKGKIYKRMAELADLLLTAQETAESYVEGTVMRGWPMYVDPKDTKQTYGRNNAAPCHPCHCFPVCSGIVFITPAQIASLTPDALHQRLSL